MKYCEKCGATLTDDTAFCSTCGRQSGRGVAQQYQKSKIAAGLLGIFLGSIGVHNFYLGYTGKAVAQLVLTIIGWSTLIVIIGFIIVPAVSLWGLIEGIMILAGSIRTDANGVPLKD
jgi:TM2 domain-containing membrane protein YozV